MICQGCGGILGRDCFNQQECISISNYIQNYDNQSLEERISYLEGLLKENGIDFLPFGQSVYDKQEYLGEGHYPYSRIYFDEETGKFETLPF